MSSAVGTWWGCETAPYQGYQPGTPVNPWDSGLPGMTQTYLDQVGQGTLGAAGYGGPPTGSSEQDWIVAALNGMGMDASPEAISALTALMNCESGGDPSAMNASGASGLMQMMPETFAAYSVGGDIMDPISNIMASINYQMGVYGHLVSACPYKEGGMAFGPHVGIVGDGGREAMLPLDNRRVMGQLRAGLGISESAGNNEALVTRLDAIASEIRNLPGPVGDAVGGGMERRMTRHTPTQRAVQGALNKRHLRTYYRGVRR
jgi:hypothetical protein